MLFSDLLDVHKSCLPKNHHPEILGDGFLIQNNPYYRNIKLKALEVGSQYVEVYSDYLLMPFLELPLILKDKKIPFAPTARLLKKIEDKNPGIFSSDDMSLPESYHLHESAHIISDCLFGKIKIRTNQEKILKILMSESFANTVDAFVCLPADDEFHLFFVSQNSYMQPQVKIMKAMNELVLKCGYRFTFMLTFFTYLHSNFLSSPLKKKFVQELLKSFDIQKSKRLENPIKTVCGIGEKLDPLFRYKTTANYFKQVGFQEDIEELLNFPFMKVFEANPEFGCVTESMSEILNPVE